jgi:fructose/tagatose bisphosphate aldolase
MWLHLDHCDDPGLIAHALDVGFDSIMADGSDRPLQLNLAFTRHAVQLGSRYGVPVEGEVGAIDPSGRRRTSRTELADVATYVRGTGVACLGVNVGQVHGSDYEYNRARRAIREIGDLDRLQRGGGAWALYEACSEMEAELAEGGVARAHDDRRRLHELRDRLVDEMGGAEDLLAAAYEGADVAFCGLLARLEQGWHRRRTRMAARKRKLFGQVAGPDVGWSEGPSHRRFLDLHLLRGVSEVIEELGARVVLHGGSSIAFDDLRLLDRMGVARVNFGSAPFAAFLGALSARSPEGRPPDRPATLPEVLRFLDEHAADWPGWLAGGGPELEAFEEQLRRRYFLPLATTGGVHA